MSTFKLRFGIYLSNLYSCPSHKQVIGWDTTGLKSITDLNQLKGKHPSPAMDFNLKFKAK